MQSIYAVAVIREAVGCAMCGHKLTQQLDVVGVPSTDGESRQALFNSELSFKAAGDMLYLLEWSPTQGCRSTTPDGQAGYHNFYFNAPSGECKRLVEDMGRLYYDLMAKEEMAQAALDMAVPAIAHSAVAVDTDNTIPW